MSEPRCTHIEVESAAQEPLVSIGVPVRNGAAFLEEALRQLVEQTHANLEIIISDNASSDGTGDIIEHFARSDTRIRVYTQSQTLTASENFRFVFEQASGEFFMWSAHDDRHSVDYVASLLSALTTHPDAILAFPEVAVFREHSDWRSATPVVHNAESNYRLTPLVQKIDANVNTLCYHVYGLIRTNALRHYSWVEIEYGPDRALLFYLCERGDFVRSTAGCFYYYKPREAKSKESRAKNNSFVGLKPFPNFRLAIVCARQINADLRKAPRFAQVAYAFCHFFRFRILHKFLKPLKAHFSRNF